MPGRRKEAADTEDKCPSWIFWQYAYLAAFQLWRPGSEMGLSKPVLACFSPRAQDPACCIPISCHFFSQNYIYFLSYLYFSSPHCPFPVLVCLMLAVISVNDIFSPSNSLLWKQKWSQASSSTQKGGQQSAERRVASATSHTAPGVTTVL